MQKFLFRIIPFVILSICLHLAMPEPGDAGADAALFKKGVASFQSNRYSDAISIFTNLLQAHPQTPFKDMTIYYLARAHLKSGHRQQAADLTSRLMREYPASYNRDTVDAELLKVMNDQARPKQVAVRPAPGAVPAKSGPVTTKPKPTAAKESTLPVKVSAGPVAAPAGKPTKSPMPPLRQPKADKKAPVSTKKPATAQTSVLLARGAKPPRLPVVRPTKPSPAPPALRAGQSPAAIDERTMPVEQFASVVGKGAIPLELGVSSEWFPVKAGSTLSIPFTLSNRDIALHKLRLSCEFPPYFLPRFQTANGGQVQDEVSIKPGATYRGALNLVMPAGAADGARFSYRIFAHSVSDAAFSASGEAGIIASAAGRD